MLLCARRDTALLEEEREDDNFVSLSLSGNDGRTRSVALGFQLATEQFERKNTRLKKGFFHLSDSRSS